MALVAGDHIVGAGLDGCIQHVVRRGDAGVIFDDPGAVEHEGDRAGFAKIAAGLCEVGADIGGGPVAVVGQRLDDHGDAAGPVALVADLIVVLTVAADRLLDRAFDVVLRHVFRPRGDHGSSQSGVHRRIRRPELRGDRDFAGQLAEQF